MIIMMMMMMMMMMFLPTQVSIDILQGKDPAEMTQKLDRAALLMVEIHGISDFCA